MNDFKDVLTVGDLMEALSLLPSNMPVFRISDYHGYVDPINKGLGPEMTVVCELEFAGQKSLHHGSMEGLKTYKVLREFSVLNLG